MEETVIIPELPTANLSVYFSGPRDKIIVDFNKALRQTANQDLEKAFDLTQLQSMITEQMQ